ncbi:hypothetical protein V2H45_03900 [Tumidithrix elongata RA019]|uniref:Uncharacterized protein n=1 Tax=Tumidithrix elongata BACA0141 TaxID=2716417 RepID=A0AAW9PTZ3_9CYAN|nr:hypothetical protein [Tumidithrix elongata RA019]
MAYSSFSLRDVEKDFSLTIEEEINLFASTESLPQSDVLRQTFAENVSLALAINTEKARSELIVMPLLLEVRRRSPVPISLFSGSEFNVDPEKGLTGYCDYLVSLSKQQLMISAPVIAVVEAKNENIKGGLGQCIAEMVAAQIFNRQQGNAIDTIYGAVTTGEIWKFLKLFNNTIQIDLMDYYIKDVDKILGILSQAIPKVA